jgi:hypothetical protein
MAEAKKAAGRAAPASKKMFGLLAEFETAQQIFTACEGVRDAGYQKWDSYTPFPVHNLDKAMGLKASRLPWIALVMGLTGATLGMTMQWWMNAVDYPFIISGKPYFSFQAFAPITFELGILLGSFGAVFGMLGINRLPQLYHSLFNSERFARVTDHRFFIAIETTDPKYDEAATRQLLEGLGATHVELVED